MGTTATLEGYLSITYRPDMDFVDRVLVERHVVDAAAGRHRVLDVMIVEVTLSKGKVVTDVPAVVFEINSPEVRFDDIMDRCFDYARLGCGTSSSSTRITSGLGFSKMAR